MNKLRIAAGLLVAAAVAVPTTAVAAISAYQPVQGPDPTGDVTNRKHVVVDRPTLDITGYAASRTDSTFTIVATYDDLVRTPYTRHIASLAINPALTPRATAVELRTGRRGNTAVTVYEADEIKGESSLATIPCPGASATPDYVADTVTYVLPASCYRDAAEPGSYLAVQSAKWKSARWQRGALVVTGKQPDLSDYDTDEWHWDTSRTFRTSGGTPHRLF